MTPEEAYRILEINAKTSLTQRKKQYHALLLRYHPDKKNGDDALAKTKSIIAAYQLINSINNKRKFAASYTKEELTLAQNILQQVWNSADAMEAAIENGTWDWAEEVTRYYKSLISNEAPADPKEQINKLKLSINDWGRFHADRNISVLIDNALRDATCRDSVDIALKAKIFQLMNQLFEQQVQFSLTMSPEKPSNVDKNTLYIYPNDNEWCCCGKDSQEKIFFEKITTDFLGEHACTSIVNLFAWSPDAFVDESRLQYFERNLPKSVPWIIYRLTSKYPTIKLTPHPDQEKTLTELTHALNEIPQKNIRYGYYALAALCTVAAAAIFIQIMIISPLLFLFAFSAAILPALGAVVSYAKGRESPLHANMNLFASKWKESRRLQDNPHRGADGFEQPNLPPSSPTLAALC